MSFLYSEFCSTLTTSNGSHPNFHQISSKWRWLLYTFNLWVSVWRNIITSSSSSSSSSVGGGGGGGGDGDGGTG